jgi:hypothetical protein
MDYLQPATSEANQVVRTGAHTLVLKQLPDAPLSLDGGPHELNTNPTPSTPEQRLGRCPHPAACNLRYRIHPPCTSNHLGTGVRSGGGLAGGKLTLQPAGLAFGR